jgi:hypothetical protein
VKVSLLGPSLLETSLLKKGGNFKLPAEKFDYAGNLFVLFGLVASVIWLVYVSFIE